MTTNPDPTPSDAERDIAMLAELAEVALDLAKAVADFTKTQMVQANDGYAHHIPADPAQAFARMAQTVRRTIALKQHLRERAATGAQGLDSAGDDLFRAPPKRGLDLNPPHLVDLPSASFETEGALDGPNDARAAGDSPAADRAAPRESLKLDLGRLLDDPERLIERPPNAPIRRIVARLCKAIDLDPDRLKWKDGRWFVARSSRDPVALWHDAPLALWRPPWPGVAIRHYVPPETRLA